MGSWPCANRLRPYSSRSVNSAQIKLGPAVLLPSSPRPRIAIAALIVAVMVGAAGADAATKTVVRSSYSPAYGRFIEGPHAYARYVYCSNNETCMTTHRSARRPPLIAHGRVTAAPGSSVKVAKLGTIKLRDGKRQVTYYGRPLYGYKGNHKPGQTKGEAQSDGRGTWFLIGTNGRPIPCPAYLTTCPASP
jgi:predicted lipoprotein with Yx(FWY)xxD motif